ncbi:hypothetical protein HK414_17985 [Ramlibacter terrae]|uniref:Uncharacterized protein n=1 Tax=Ramlibacter terrae TaxID=2732511 RepID=A0ABX6P411_9BURK|nr:hypothetical protein HK414_17985 [Ramlibacter terrae]
MRAAVLELARPARWDTLAAAWQGVQAELDLPPPAIAVNGRDGHQLWFSLAPSIEPAQATALLEALIARYLPEVPPDRIAMTPSAAPPTEVVAGRWSAFVAQDLASVFADEPRLDLPPSADAQADMLSRLKSIQPEALENALERLRAAAAPASAPAPAAAAATAGEADPRRFLLSVMNDPAVDLRLRIEAAKALLPSSHR